VLDVCSGRRLCGVQSLLILFHLVCAAAVYWSVGTSLYDQCQALVYIAYSNIVTVFYT
jgi:uncharacterized membrane protein YwzB